MTDRYAKVIELDSSTYSGRQEWKVTISVQPTMVRFDWSPAAAQDLPPEARAALREWLNEADAR